MRSLRRGWGIVKDMFAQTENNFDFVQSTVVQDIDIVRS